MNLTIEFRPCLSENVEQVCLPCHGVLAGVSSGSSKEDDLGLADEGDSVAETRHWNLAIHIEFLNCLTRICLKTTNTTATWGSLKATHIC